MNQPHYIKAGWLFDGGSGPVQRNVLLTVEDGIITTLESFSEASVLPVERVTDLSRCTVLPPFVDCHAHLSLSSSTDQRVRQGQLRASYHEVRPRIAENIHYHFSHGVLAVRDGGDSQGHGLRFRNEAAVHKREPVLVKATSRAWYQKGRYGQLLGRHPHPGESLVGSYERENVAVDHVKVINSGLNSLLAFAKESAPQFGLEELKAIVESAHRQGQKVMVHANGELPVRIALEAGCDSIEHGYFMGDANLCRMADREITWVPTVYTMKTLGEHGILHGPVCDRGVLEKNIQHQLGQLRRARDYGVRVAVGTDAGSWGVIHGESLVEELKLLLKAGFSLAETLHCASGNGARLLGIDSLGHLAVGRPANFIVARATPAMLPRKLSYLEGIYLNGLPCDKKFFEKV